MPSMNTKNAGLAAASTDLGLGDELKNQVEAQTDMIKKKAQDNIRQRQLFPASGILLDAPITTGGGM